MCQLIYSLNFQFLFNINIILAYTVRLEKIIRRNADNISDFIQRNVQLGSLIISDQWRGYLRLNSLGYLNMTVNHSAFFVDPYNPLIHTNTIERLWRSLKTFIPKNTRLADLNRRLLLFEMKYNFKMQNGYRKI